MARSAERQGKRGGAGRSELGREVSGVVVHLHARHASVRSADGTWHCSLRKSLFSKTSQLTQPIAVGDRVAARVWGPRDGVVERVFERTSCLSRSWQGSSRQQVIVANVDLVVVVSSLAEPALRPRLIDRVLVAAEREDLDAVIVLNKLDLVPDPSVFKEFSDLYAGLGYPVFFTSAVTDAGLPELRSRLKDRTAVLAGHSGVGKSSLLNRIQPGLALRVGEISDKWHKGRHTTTSVSLLALDGGGFVVDTPGFRAFGVTGLESWQVSLLFPELKALAPECQFSTCSHTHEPGCAARRALKSGTLDPRRFESYLRIVEGETDWLAGGDDPEEEQQP